MAASSCLSLAVVVKSEHAGDISSISSAERFALSVISEQQPGVPETKRQRIERSRSPSAPPHDQVDTAMSPETPDSAMPPETPDSLIFRSPPGTPIGSGGAPLCRNDMAEFFEKIRALLVPVQDSIGPAVQAAILPVQAQVSDIAERLEKLERIAARNTEAW